MEINLYQHQKDAIARAERFTSYAIFAETGTGKTIIAIEIIKKRFVPTLVVCPLSIIESVWMQSLQQFYPESNPINLWKIRKKLIGRQDFSANTVGIINYESLKKLPPDFIRSFSFLILDESSKVKDPRSQITEFIAGNTSGRRPGIAHLFPYRLIMSGTPAPNTPMEYWSQMAIVDREILDPNFYRFREKHFENPQYSKFAKYIWRVKEGHEKLIIDAIRQRSFYISKKECLDLPEQTFTSKTYAMTPEQRTAYVQMKRHSLAEIKDTAVLGANEVAKIMKLRQITSGFIKTETGEAVFISDGKMKLLEETLDEIGNTPVIIWCQFHYEIERIKALLGDKAVTLYGDMGAQSNKDQAIEDFKSGKAQYLIAHPKSGGMGLTLVNCSYNIYYSMDYSYESLKQSEDRTHRIGQKQNVTYIFLMAAALSDKEKSIDQIIYQAVVKKEGLSDALLKMINSEDGEGISTHHVLSQGLFENDPGSLLVQDPRRGSQWEATL